MAASAGPETTIGKRCLNAPLYVSHVRGGNEVTYTAVDWLIHQFSQLKENVVHTKAICDMRLSLVITEGTLTFTLHTSESNMKVKCYFGGHSRPHFSAEEIAVGVYESEIPLKCIQVPENTFLQKDALKFQIRFKTCGERNLNVRPFAGERNALMNCIDKLHDDIAHRSPNESTKANFMLFLDDSICFIHKEFLAARSKFFYSYLKEAPKLGEMIGYHLDTTVLAMDKVKDYIYSGEIKMLQLNEMIDIFNLSVELKIPSLQSLCTVALKESIDLYNADEIHKVGSEHGVKSLLEALNRYVESFL